MTVIHQQPIQKIYKEEIKDIVFKSSVGYFTDCELRDRHRKLHLSILLVNYREAIVKIIFNTVEGYKELTTSIWGATEKHILLTGGTFIPVESVAWVSLD